MNKNSVIKNMMWKFAERCGSQGITFMVSIILARVLSPDEYGTIALVTVFITILNVFVSSGFPNALIQKKDADELDFSTVFYFNMFSCTVMYIILYFCAPFVANFYENETLTILIRVLGIKLIISGFLAVQNAYISKKMQFKKFFYSTLSATILSGVIGTIMVYSGCGVWSLVGQTLSLVCTSTIILWFTSDFRPKLMFSIKRLKGLFSYGWKLLVFYLIDTIYTNLRSLIIGKGYSDESLAYYNKANQFPALIINNLNNSIDGVLFPVMAKIQDNIIKLKIMTRKSIKTTGYIVWPCMIGLFVCAEPLIELILTEKWLPCVPYLRLFCIIYAFKPTESANLNAIKSLGRSDLLLKLQIIKKAIGVFSIILTMNYGVFAIAVAAAIVAPIEMFINASPNKRLINYSYKEQIKDILPAILNSVFMGACIWFIQYLTLPLILILILQVLVGSTVYIVLSMIFKLEAFNTVLSLLKNIKKNEEL
ncbi:MAG: lipopolysaccharide biosynthesis protein [Clostridia bacterium]